MQKIKSSAGHRIRWDHDEWRAPGIVCEGSEGAGCDSVNVSLDTVDAAEFAALTGRDALEQVKQGICALKRRVF